MELLLNKYFSVDLLKVHSSALEAFAIEDCAFLLRGSAGKAGSTGHHQVVPKMTASASFPV